MTAIRFPRPAESAIVAIVVGAAALPFITSPAGSSQAADPWAPIRFLQGTWQGTAEGEPGKGTVERSYAFVLKNRFLHERNTSTYPAQAANKAGEIHEHVSYFSHDRKRDVLVLRQFHQEGFVNQFAVAKDLSSAKRIVFDSESLENVGTWRARETYDVISNDEFVETFELGQPGKPLTVYSKTHFRRVGRSP
jgi:hypothetical protein